MVPAAVLERPPEPDDGRQAEARERVAVQLDRQQARRRDGQLPGTERAAAGRGRRGNSERAFEHFAGDPGAERLRKSVVGQLVAQAQAGHRGEGHLLGPGGAGWRGRHCDTLHGHPAVVLGAWVHGHSGQSELFQLECGERRAAERTVAQAAGPHRQQHQRGTVHPRRQYRHGRKKRGGGLVLQEAEPGGPAGAALLQILQWDHPVRQRKRPAAG